MTDTAELQQQVDSLTARLKATEKRLHNAIGTLARFRRKIAKLQRDPLPARARESKTVVSRPGIAEKQPTPPRQPKRWLRDEI